MDLELFLYNVGMNDKSYSGYLTGHNLSDMSVKFNEYLDDSNFIGFYVFFFK